MGRTLEAYAGMTMATMADRFAKRWGMDTAKIPPVFSAWIRAGILKPEGGAFTGKGNFHTFSDAELFKAAILYQLSWQGCPTGLLRSARRRMDYHLKKTPTILTQAASGKEWDFLFTRLLHTIPIKGVVDEEDIAVWAEFKKRPYKGNAWGKIMIPGSGSLSFETVTTVRVDHVLRGL